MEQWKGARVVDPLAARHALGNLKASMGLATAPQQLRLGRYELGALLGTGSFGKVYKARDPELDRDVALKLFHPEIFETRESKDRARVEARALAAMHHPHVVQVFDVGAVEDRFFIVMELVEGETVEEWVARTKPGADAILDVFTQAGKGLAAAHAAGVLHLDFKPSNVMRTAQGRAVVLDFGLARGLPMTPERPAYGISVLPNESVAALGGTPAFMPPEQFEPRAVVDETADVYAFGASLLSVSTGHDLRAATTLEALVERKRSSPTLPKGELDPRISSVLRRALAPEPADRYPSMDALLLALDRARHPRGRRVVLGAVAAVGVSAFAWDVLANVEDDCEAASGRTHATLERQRTNVRETLGGLGRGDAATEAALDRLDAYARRWAETWRLACREGEREAMDCLEHRADAYAARLAALQTASAFAEQLRLVTDGLTPPAECRRAAFLASSRIAADPEAAATIARLERWATGVSRTEPGNDPRARIAEAEALGHAPTLAAVLQESAEVANEQGEYALARERFARAYDIALEARHDVLALDAAGLMLGLPPDTMTRAEFRRWGGAVQAVCDRRPDAERLCAVAMVNLSQALSAFGEYDAASAAVEGVLDYADRAAHDDKLRTRLPFAAGATAIWRGEDAAALRHFSHGLELADDSDPFRAELVLAVAAAHAKLEHLEQAEQTIRRGLERSPPPDVQVRMTVVLAQVIAKDTARVDEALELLAATQRELCPQSATALYCGTLALTQGDTLLETERIPDARRALERARTIYTLEDATPARHRTSFDQTWARLEAAGTETTEE